MKTYNVLILTPQARPPTNSMLSSEAESYISFTESTADYNVLIWDLSSIRGF